MVEGRRLVVVGSQNPLLCSNQMVCAALASVVVLLKRANSQILNFQARLHISDSTPSMAFHRRHGIRLYTSIKHTRIINPTQSKFRRIIWTVQARRTPLRRQALATTSPPSFKCHAYPQLTSKRRLFKMYVFSSRQR